MKKRIIICILASLFLFAAPAKAVYTIDLGSFEPVEYTYSNWGPTEPDTHNGGWGLFGSGGDNRPPGTPPTVDHKCKTVWGYLEGDPGSTWAWNDPVRSASVTFPEKIYSVTIRHLDGGSDDSLDIYVDGVLWGHYTGLQLSGEQWTVDTYSGTPGYTLTITASGPTGPYWNPYGQAGIEA